MAVKFTHVLSVVTFGRVEQPKHSVVCKPGIFLSRSFQKKSRRALLCVESCTYFSSVLAFVSEQRGTSVLSLCLKGRGGYEDRRTSSFRLSPLYPALSCVCFGAVLEFQPPLRTVFSRHILNKMQNVEKENITETRPIYQSTE